MSSLDQRRAEDALRQVRSLPSDGSVNRRSYRAYVDRLGPTIMMNGLGQALATEVAAAGPGGQREPDKQAHHLLYRNVSAWLCREGDGPYPPSGAGDLLKALTEGNEAAYLRAQADALAWLAWHKKFCRAEIAEPTANEEDG